MLFEGIVFGPVKSRRLGVSLGVNLLPPNSKICSFNCLYCECGFNFSSSEKYPTFEQVSETLEQRLKMMKEGNEPLDVITFAGNGEPTLHPDFERIIDATIALRNCYFPQVKVSVLSNATRIGNETVFRALKKVDNNILKLDSAVDSTLKLINQPIDEHFSVEDVVRRMSLFSGDFILQTLFLKGEYKGVSFDNTTDDEVAAWLDVVKRLKPKQVMIYSLDRKTPVECLQRPSVEKLLTIARRVELLGVNASVTE